MTPKPVALDDKYTLDTGRAFMTGIQALVRLPMVQRQRDLAGSTPLGGVLTLLGDDHICESSTTGCMLFAAAQRTESRTQLDALIHARGCFKIL